MFNKTNFLLGSFAITTSLLITLPAIARPVLEMYTPGIPQTSTGVVIAKNDPSKAFIPLGFRVKGTIIPLQCASVTAVNRSASMSLGGVRPDTWSEITPYVSTKYLPAGDYKINGKACDQAKECITASYTLTIVDAAPM